MLDNLLKKMRIMACNETITRKIPKRASCSLKAVTDPEALPVDFFPKKEEFTELNEYVSTLSEPPHTNVRFKYGTICSDGRYDMCKQGIRNAYVDACKSVEIAKGIKHYLLGNNLICQDDDENIRLDALVKMIKARPDIITWFIAGNSILDCVMMG